MRDLPIRKISGFGRVNERLLDSIGVKVRCTFHYCRVVICSFCLFDAFQTSYCHGSSSLTLPIRTFKAISEKENILQKLEEIAAELEDDMESGGWAGRTVTLKYKLDTYEVFTRAKSFNRWIKTKAELYEAGKELLQPEWPLCLRLIGLRVTKLKDLQKKDGGILKVWGVPLLAVRVAVLYVLTNDMVSRSSSSHFLTLHQRILHPRKVAHTTVMAKSQTSST